MTRKLKLIIPMFICYFLPIAIHDKTRVFIPYLLLIFGFYSKFSAINKKLPRAEIDERPPHGLRLFELFSHLFEYCTRWSPEQCLL